MPRTRAPYPPEFRREAVELVLAGRSVRDVAESLGCSDQSLHNWVKQHQLDRRERDDGLTSAEREELRRAAQAGEAPRAGARHPQASRGPLRSGDRDPVSTYRIISAERASFPVSVMCEVLGVSRSGYHGWESRAPSDRALSDAWLTSRITEIHERARGVYGSRRVQAELRLGQGIEVSRKRVRRLMRQAGISGLVKVKRGRTTIRVPGVRVADDLVERKFRPDAPNVLWVADITYLRTWEGWLYLAAVQDAYCRRIVGWAMAEHMRTELVADALQMAVHRRRPEPGLIHHSDQGSQYVALGFGQQARDAGIAVSMGSKGDAYDNAVAESFFATLKKELVHRQSWPSRRELSSAVFDYIEAFYNRQRRHSTLGYLSPEEYENTTITTTKET